MFTQKCKDDSQMRFNISVRIAEVISLIGRSLTTQEQYTKTLW